MPWAAAAAGVASVAGGLISSSGAQSAANTQAQAATEAARVQKQMFDTTQANLQPWMQGGGNALTALQQALGIGPGGGGSVNPSGFQQSPGYQWQMDQGLTAVENSAAAKGGLSGGNTLKALQSYGTGLANQDWYNYLGQLGGLSASGQNAAANLGGIATTTGQGIGNSLITAGNAQAGGIAGSTNALTGAINNLGGIGMSGNYGGGSSPFATPLYNGITSLGTYGNTGGAGTNSLQSMGFYNPLVS
jgi:hypothetical protein